MLPTEARQLIDAASFGPEALKAIGMPFDAAWAKISPSFGDDPVDVEEARIRLTEALLSNCQRELSGRRSAETHCIATSAAGEQRRGALDQGPGTAFQFCVGRILLIWQTHAY